MAVSKQGLVPSAYDGGIVSDFKEGKFSRRNFLMLAGFGSISVLGGVKAVGKLSAKTPIIADAKGVLFHDATRCTACFRCELACSEFNDGAASSYLARVHAYRNQAFGPSGATSMGDGATVAGSVQGVWGNFRQVVETCKQCPHPVPCAEACPQGAIQVEPNSGARKINTALCIGCGICTVACPWQMPTLNTSIHKASKCFLCNGSPECARACPTGSLKYVPWRDLRSGSPLVQSGIMPASTQTNCAVCHSN
jgi:Fe-S-cluster-containing dehydrogenase component